MGYRMITKWASIWAFSRLKQSTKKAIRGCDNVGVEGNSGKLVGEVLESSDIGAMGGATEAIVIWRDHWRTTSRAEPSSFDHWSDVREEIIM
ncbi:hypothetical protein TIFTF001_027870 [Ficus carica]|uniref:Uncharacterized protein n=1 Tax=Ficus carica TaxID=3494 RepID=A0AA88DNS0_FICCA|nr:hypothetical protein TIFTF001_027870 [Ficus carica]